MKSGNVNHHPNYREFLLDTPEDVVSLPSIEEVAWGATAFVISTGDVYILNSKGDWVVI